MHHIVIHIQDSWFHSDGHYRTVRKMLIHTWVIHYGSGLFDLPPLPLMWYFALSLFSWLHACGIKCGQECYIVAGQLCSPCLSDASENSLAQRASDYATLSLWPQMCRITRIGICDDSAKFKANWSGGGTKQSWHQDNRVMNIVRFICDLQKFRKTQIMLDLKFHGCFVTVSLCIPIILMSPKSYE